MNNRSIPTRTGQISSILLSLLAVGCSNPKQDHAKRPTKAAEPPYFEVDAESAGVLRGRIRFLGKKPAQKKVDMSDDPACGEARHRQPAFEDLVVTGRSGNLANAFVYIKSGLEGKRFAVPPQPVIFDQRGCWFRPRVIGVQTGQVMRIVNSDPVTHNVHPLAQVNREWNHSQGPGDPPLTRRFPHQEIMMRVKCNIHSWMRAYIGVVDHPYFAVTGDDGSYEIKGLPPGEYTVAAWQEQLGTEERKVSLKPSFTETTDFVFKGE